MNIDYFFDNIVTTIDNKKNIKTHVLIKTLKKKFGYQNSEQSLFDRIKEYVLNGFIHQSGEQKNPSISLDASAYQEQKKILVMRYAREILYRFWITDINGKKPEDFGEKTFQQLTLKPGDIPKKYGRTQEEIETICASAIELLIGQKLLQQNENNNYVVTKDVIEYYNTDIFDEDSIL